MSSEMFQLGLKILPFTQLLLSIKQHCFFLQAMCELLEFSIHDLVHDDIRDDGIRHGDLNTAMRTCSTTIVSFDPFPGTWSAEGVPTRNEGLRGTQDVGAYRTFKLGVHFFSLHRNSNFLKRPDHSCCRGAEEGRPIFCWRGSIATSVHHVKIDYKIK